MATKNYVAIAKAKIRRPSSVTRPPRILVYARNKKGKTRFCTTAGKGRILIVDPEGGTDSMKRLDPDVWPLETWEEIDEVHKFLKLGRHNYEWVAIDGMTKIHNMALKWVMGQAEKTDLDRKPGLVQQRDYGKAGEISKTMIHNFRTLPIGVIFTAQERIMNGYSSGDDDEDSEDAAVAYVPDLPNGVRGELNGAVDIIGRLYTVKLNKRFRDKTTRKIVEKEIIQRRLWLAPNIMYDTGARSDYRVPEYLADPTIPKLVSLINEGKTE
jgi:AAA domain